MLLKLFALQTVKNQKFTPNWLIYFAYLAKIPRSYCIVQSAGPKFRSVVRYIDATSAVRVPLELAKKNELYFLILHKIVEIP